MKLVWLNLSLALQPLISMYHYVDIFCCVVKAALLKIIYISSEVLSPRKSSAIITPSQQLRHSNSLTKDDQAGLSLGAGVAEPVACKSTFFLYALS